MIEGIANYKHPLAWTVVRAAVVCYRCGNIDEPSGLCSHRSFGEALSCSTGDGANYIHGMLKDGTYVPLQAGILAMTHTQSLLGGVWQVAVAASQADYDQILARVPGLVPDTMD